MAAMNQLNVSLQQTTLTLAANGWSRRRIARELGIHRETVGRHLGLASSKPAIVLAGSDPVVAAKPAISLTGDLALAPAVAPASGWRPAPPPAPPPAFRQICCSAGVTCPNFVFGLQHGLFTTARQPLDFRAFRCRD